MKSGTISMIRLNLLYDIALLIRKYKSEIEWETIINRAVLWNQYGEVLLALKIYNEIFPNDLPDWIFQNLKYEALLFYSQNIYNGLDRRIVPLLLKVNILVVLIILMIL